MIRTLTERMAKDIGFDIGMSDDMAQSELLNSLGRGILAGCKNDHAKTEMQMCYIAEKLDRNGAKMVIELAEFLKLREGGKEATE